jgi:hypothetical protein
MGRFAGRRQNPVLAGLRYSREEVGPIMEYLDPYDWGATSPNPEVSDPEGLVLPLQRPSRRALVVHG